MSKNALKSTLLGGLLLMTISCQVDATNHTAVKSQSLSTKVQSLVAPSSTTQSSTASSMNISEKVQVLSAKAPNLDPKVLQLALTAYTNANKSGIVQRKVLTVIDYHQPNYNKRLWVFDLAHNKLLYNTWVAHGQGSGFTTATRFSDKPQTHQSSIGVFVTGNTYYGHVGYALRLHGMDKGYNDKAFGRAIVMHGAWYVNEKFVTAYHRIGRSWGCPSVSKQMARPIINAIKDGSVIFAYAPNYGWLHHSAYLHSTAVQV